MSRDWTPFEHYMVEQQHIKEGRGDLFDFMEGLKLVPVNSVTGEMEEGESERLSSPEEMALRRQFPYLGKYLFDDFPVLYEKISAFVGGVEFLHQKDFELGKIIESRGKDVDKSSYLFRWFVGKLDEHFYYSMRNNELLIDSICAEAREKGLSNWILTDPDCLQFRRQIGFCDSGVFELMQIENFGKDAFVLAIAEIDCDDIDPNVKDSILKSYDYENMGALVDAAGSRNEAYALLAEMFFETTSSEYYVLQFADWNNALAEVERRTGRCLDAFKEADNILLDDVIKEASSFHVSAQPEECGSIKDTDFYER